MIYQLREKMTDETTNIYGVKREGKKTYFLTFSYEWAWIDSSYFEPLKTREELQKDIERYKETYGDY